MLRLWEMKQQIKLPMRDKNCLEFIQFVCPLRFQLPIIIVNKVRKVKSWTKLRVGHVRFTRSYRMSRGKLSECTFHGITPMITRHFLKDFQIARSIRNELQLWAFERTPLSSIYKEQESWMKSEHRKVELLYW